MACMLIWFDQLNQFHDMAVLDWQAAYVNLQSLVLLADLVLVLQNAVQIWQNMQPLHLFTTTVCLMQYSKWSYTVQTYNEYT